MRPPNRTEMEDFKRILNQEIETYKEIEHYLDRKKGTIIQGDLESLMHIDVELEKLTQRTRELEQDRLAVMVKMGREGDTLKALITSLQTGDDTEALEQAQDRLVTATSNIRELSQVNRDLLTQSIRFIEQSVDFIASILAPEGASYSNTLRPGSGGNLSGHPPHESYGAASTICREA